MAPCYALSSLRLCGLASIGAVTAEGSGATEETGSASSVYVALGARAALDQPLSSAFSLRVHADALAPATRTTVRAGDIVLWTTPALSAALGIALAARWN